MSKIKISTDSTADIPHRFCEELNISVLPLTVLAEGKEYRDGVDIAPEEFYEIIDRSKVLPVSSQVSTVLYTQLYEEVWRAGYSDLIHIAINSKGSGTYQAGVLARELFFEEHPEAREVLRIELIDSKTYSMAYGIPVIEAAMMVRDGAEKEAILEHLQDWLANTRPMFVPLNLRCVKKSGRISPAAAFAGDALGLKPLITFADGEAQIIGKARGEAKAIAALVDAFLAERKPGSNYALVHGRNMEAFEKLKAAVEEVADIAPIAEYPVGCIIGINTGPDMIGILYRT